MSECIILKFNITVTYFEKKRKNHPFYFPQKERDSRVHLPKWNLFILVYFFSFHVSIFVQRKGMRLKGQKWDVNLTFFFLDSTKKFDSFDSSVNISDKNDLIWFFIFFRFVIFWKLERHWISFNFFFIKKRKIRKKKV